MRNMNYFDLIIVEHSSFIEKDMLKVWKVLEKLHFSRSVRNIGLSGFTISQMKYILSVAVIKPFAVQALFNPYSVNLELIKFCQNEDLLLFAMSPIDYQKSERKLQSENRRLQIERAYVKNDQIQITEKNCIFANL